MSGLRNQDGTQGRIEPPRSLRRTFALGIVTSGAVAFAVGSLAVPAHAGPTIPGAPVNAPASSPSAAKPSSLKYVVQNGDYLWGIAIKLGVTFGDLLAVNSFTTDTVIIPGQAVVVPEGGALPVTNPATNPATPAVQTPAVQAPATPAAPLSYTILNGDSLAGIAQRMGVTLPLLLSTNKLTVASVIHPGGQLAVPAGGHLPAPRVPAVGAIENAATTPPAPVLASRINDAASVPANVPAATPAPATPAAPTLPAGYTSYTVIAGDYLVGIAAKSGVTLRALLAANGLITTSSIQPGRLLSVPPPTLPIPTVTPDAATSTDSAGATPAGGAPATPATPATGPTASQQSIATVLTFLQAQIGKPYAFNTAGPDTYDCSGLVTAAYEQIGIELPHQSLLQSTKGTAVDWLTQPLLPGDLIFQYSTANPTVISHVGIVIDASHWIQAAGSGTPVKIGPLPNVAKIRAVRRIVQP